MTRAHPTLLPPHVQMRAMRRISNPILGEWSVHGLGFLRTYLDEARTWRLHVWHRCLRNEGISALHTHPWGFRSWILTGLIIDENYMRSSRGNWWQEGQITCGPQFCGLEDTKLTRLLFLSSRYRSAGSAYEYQPDMIHETSFIDGTVTIIHRTPPQGDGKASVFWPRGQVWGSAERAWNAQDTNRAFDAARSLLGDSL